MDDPDFAVNLEASPRITRVGTEQTPVIVIDDFAEDTGPIAAYAQLQSFGVDTTSAYPGVRAELAKSHVVAALRPLLPMLYDVYSIPSSLKLRPRSTFYSLVSTPAAELRASQRVPHFDSNAPYYFALTHYLHAGTHGGTGLFRHRPTGFERITADRLDTYIGAGERFFAEHGQPPARYISGSDAHYELYETIGYVPNRLLVHPGFLLHSGLIDPATDVDGDPGTGRLTANIFVEFE